MKGTGQFKETIAAYLEQRAAQDGQFAAMRSAVNRPIEDIVTYILNQVKASGCCGFSDDEIFGIAVHAAETADLDIGKPIPGCQVVINHQVQLTEAEKAEARQKAIEALQREEMNRMRRPITPKAQKPKVEKAPEPSLFDFGME